MENKLIGNTPMIKINYKYKGEQKSIYTKLEYYNLTGSIKDRVAYYIITKANERGTLKDNMPIIEATSGNTGIALAALGAYYNHPTYIFMPDWASKERVKLMKSYGAEVILVSREEGGFKACLEKAEKLAKEKLGMQKLTNKQTVYVTLPKKDYVEVATEKVVIDEGTNWFEEFVNKIFHK